MARRSTTDDGVGGAESESVRRHHSADNVVTGHGTQKPVRLFEIPVTNHTVAGDAVYDPFCGSGTALIASEKLGRACFAMEIDPKYVQAAVTRWEAFTGMKAVRHRVTRPTTTRAR